MGIKISSAVILKLSQKHGVTEEDVIQCFSNINGTFLIDNREQHKPDPPTMWFISTTDTGRQLKVVFIKREGDVHIRTAYQPNETEMLIYNKFGANK